MTKIPHKPKKITTWADTINVRREKKKNVSENVNKSVLKSDLEG